MHPEIFWPLATFAFVAGITPGPNNLMLMTSGVKYGLGPTLPHMAGVILGFGLMIAIVGLGLDVLFQRFPQILPIMRIAASIYMIWLALKIALAQSPFENRLKGFDRDSSLGCGAERRAAGWPRSRRRPSDIVAKSWIERWPGLPVEIDVASTKAFTRQLAAVAVGLGSGPIKVLAGRWIC